MPTVTLKIVPGASQTLRRGIPDEDRLVSFVSGSDGMSDCTKTCANPPGMTADYLGSLNFTVTSVCISTGSPFSR